MKSSTISVHWHDECQPVYSLHFQPGADRFKRLATAGGDNNARVWRVKYPKSDDPLETTVEYLCTLRKHSQAVNVVKFDTSGRFLATASDDGLLIVWTLSLDIVTDFGHQDDEATESWVTSQVHTTNLEVYDLAWSPNSRYLALTCMDNTTKIYDIRTNLKACELKTHSHYVQGVAWDPRNEFLATLSADRSMHMYTLDFSDGIKVTLLSKMNKTDQYQQFVSTLAANNDARADNSSLPEKHPAHLYYSETLQSFFRRLAFSPDGSLLLTPLGVFKKGENTSSNSSGDNFGETTSVNSVYVYIRSGLDRSPICHIPGFPKPTVAVSFNPIFYGLSNIAGSIFSLPYKMVFAVATHNSVYVFDTVKLQPLGVVSNLHYMTITDLCWDNDGQSLIVSSAEGFCSVILFEEDVFGAPYTKSNVSNEVPSFSMKPDSSSNKGLDGYFSRSKVVKPSELDRTAAVPTESSKAADDTSAKDRKALISNFLAQPIVLNQESVCGKLSSESKDEVKKKRVVPTLLQDYK